MIARGRALLARARLRLRPYADTHSSRISFWTDRLRSGYLNTHFAPEQVEKSRRIVEALATHCSDARSLHELGIGSGRNVQHALERLPWLEVSGNDLDLEQCRRVMPGDVAARVTLHERDTLAFLRDEVSAGRTVDVVLSADHLIHIPPDSIEEILRLLPRYARRYVVLHEGVRRRPERRDSFWYLHDYTQLERDLELVHRRDLEDERFAEYAIMVWRVAGRVA